MAAAQLVWPICISIFIGAECVESPDLIELTGWFLLPPPLEKKNCLAKPQNLHISKNRFDGGRGIIYDRIGGLNQLDILFLKKKRPIHAERTARGRYKKK